MLISQFWVVKRQCIPSKRGRGLKTWKEPRYSLGLFAVSITDRIEARPFQWKHGRSSKVASLLQRLAPHTKERTSNTCNQSQ